MDKRVPDGIMRRGSTTFFNSSLFFPTRVRADVVTLYTFVRTADDMVDRKPQDAEGFHAFRQRYRDALEAGVSDDRIVDGFVELSNRCEFRPEWTESFLDAMEQDLSKGTYLTMSETEQYMRGSAEVVGMMMARIMSLPDASLPYAGMLGRAYQYLNFIRDVREDLDLNRAYIPHEEILAAGLPDLSVESALKHPDGWTRLILSQLEYYRRWRREGADGYRFIPRRDLAAIKTASDIFDYTAREIEKQPSVVLRRKVKPTKTRVIATGLRNLIVLGLKHAPQRVGNGDARSSDCL